MTDFKFGDKIWVNSSNDPFASGFFTIVKSNASRYSKGSVVDKDGFIWIDAGEYCPVEQWQVEPERKE